MTLVDANLLVYAFTRSTPEHERASAWLDDQIQGGQQIALPWESVNAFARLVSNRRVFERPAPLAEAWEQVQRWLAVPNVWMPAPKRQHVALMGEMVATGRFSADDVPDVHLAALTISHGLKLATHDSGFSRMDRLRWFDPLR